MAKDCEFYELRSSLFSYYNYCIKKGQEISEDTYERYCTNYNSSKCHIKNQSNSSGGCFITTIVCNVLGKQDNDKVLGNMRLFRENILKNNPDYYRILWEYDEIGPAIACSIQHDSNKLKLATCLYDSVLCKASDYIERQENEKAISVYQIMVMELIDKYGLKDTYEQIKNSYDINHFDVKSSGHGRVLRREYNERPIEA